MGFTGRKKKPFECPNCGFEGQVPVKGAGPLIWVAIVAIVWNAWLFHRAHMEIEALVACVFALVAAWGVSKLPKWIRCPACGWKHPVGEGDDSRF
ncbi:MAG: hypothetical protein AAB214_16740 [Fibrobacterota bacterium]